MKLFWALQTRAQRAIWLLEEADFMAPFVMLPETRNLRAYADRCAARPAHQRAVALGAE